MGSPRPAELRDETVMGKESKGNDAQGGTKWPAISAGFAAVPATVATGYVWPIAGSIAIVLLVLALLALVVGFRLPGR